MELYNTAILRLAANLGGLERLENPHHTVHQVSRVCGSALEIDVQFDESGAILDYAQTVNACALGQASASLVEKNVRGETADTFGPVARAMRVMLTGEGPAPVGKWAELEMFSDAADYKSRHGSILLPFDAVEEAFKRRERDGR